MGGWVDKNSPGGGNKATRARDVALKRWESDSKRNLSLEVCRGCFTWRTPPDSPYQGAAATACLRLLLSDCHPQAATADSYLGEAEATRIYLVQYKQVLRTQHEGAKGDHSAQGGKCQVRHESFGDSRPRPCLGTASKSPLLRKEDKQNMGKRLLLKPLHLQPTHLVCPLLLLGPKQAELMPSRQKDHFILAFSCLQASLALPQPQGPAHEFLQK